MKKITKLFTLVVAFLCLFTLASCNNNDNTKYYKVENDFTTGILAAQANLVENKKVVGFYDHDTKKMYTATYIGILPQDEYMVVYTSVDADIYPSIHVSGSNFGGWLYSYEKDGQTVTTRVTTIDAVHQVLEAKMMSFAEAGLVAIVCMAIVFGMLALISGVLYLFRFIAPKQVVETKQEKVTKTVAPTRKAIKLEDIQDDDMMAAALVATIDYHEETGEDVRVVSIKEVK